MVKGIHRQVLEIKETDSKYFERAFFFVRPEYADSNAQKLHYAAEEALKQTTEVPKAKRKKKKHIWLFVGAVLLSALLGAAVTALCFL